MGTELGRCVTSTKVGKAIGAGGVKVDKRVEVIGQNQSRKQGWINRSRTSDYAGAGLKNE